MSLCHEPQLHPGKKEEEEPELISRSLELEEA
jgi:hypothetical protein